MDEARKILGENAIDVYGLDRTKLAKVAERIGPNASEVFAESAVDGIPPALIEDFNRRNRIYGDAEKIDIAVLDAAVEQDQGRLAAAR